MRPIVLCLCLLLSAVPLRAAAHGDLHQQIVALTAKLREQPANALLYHKRGELHRAHGEYRAAFADYERAEKLDPELHVVHLSRGRALAETRRFAEAKQSLTRFLQVQPEHAEAHLLRGRAHASLGEREQAEADFQRTIAETSEPTPDQFVERAENLDAAGRPADALRVLEEGLQKLPGLVVLQLAAMELELKLMRFDAALSRVNGLLAQAPRKEALQAQKADILERAGRGQDARVAREEALATIAGLPDAKRKLVSTKTLEQELRNALAAGGRAEARAPR
jgi:tetratricopeptide (TPR) repeat protein